MHMCRLIPTSHNKTLCTCFAYLCVRIYSRERFISVLCCNVRPNFSFIQKPQQQASKLQGQHLAHSPSRHDKDLYHSAFHPLNYLPLCPSLPFPLSNTSLQINYSPPIQYSLTLEKKEPRIFFFKKARPHILSHLHSIKMF